MKNRSLILAFFATIIQYYDYALFGLSASILTEKYIPDSDSIPNFISFFAILTFAVVMRPVGSIVFGKIGDISGRSIVIKISIFLAAISTLLIGIIEPSKNIISASLLIFARMIFMMSLAGEGDGVRIYVAETIGKKQEFFGNALVTSSSQIGVLIASAMYFLSCSDVMPEYWWRMNFIIGGGCGMLLLYFRHSMEESKEFSDFIKLKNNNKEERSTFIITDHYKTIISGIIIMGFIGGIYHFYVIFYGSYLSSILGVIAKDIVSKMHILSIILYIASTLLSGYMADKYNPYIQSLIGLFISFILALLNAIFLYKGIVSVILFLFSVAIIPVYTTPLQIIFKRKILITNRLKIFSISHSVGSLLFSSSSALISGYLWHVTNKSFVPMIYVMIMILIIFSTVMLSFQQK